MTPPGEPPQTANLSSSALNSWLQARAWTQAYRLEPSALVMSLFFEDQEQGNRRKRRMLATLRAIFKEKRTQRQKPNQDQSRLAAPAATYPAACGH